MFHYFEPSHQQMRSRQVRLLDYHPGVKLMQIRFFNLPQASCGIFLEKFNHCESCASQYTWLKRSTNLHSGCSQLVSLSVSYRARAFIDLHLSKPSLVQCNLFPSQLDEFHVIRG